MSRTETQWGVRPPTLGATVIPTVHRTEAYAMCSTLNHTNPKYLGDPWLVVSRTVTYEDWEVDGSEKWPPPRTVDPEAFN